MAAYDWTAGEVLTAAKLDSHLRDLMDSITVGGADLADNTDVGGSAETWGAAQTISQPPGAVKLVAHAVGYWLNATDNVIGDLWIEISDDGGSTWTAGDAGHDSSTDARRVNVDPGSGTRVGASASAYYTGTPSGNIQIRARVLLSAGSTGNLQTAQGALTWTMVPAV